MKLSLRSSKKWSLSAIGILLVLLVLKIVLVLTAKPKVTVDYVAEYNKITIPPNYDPNDNAADNYQKAFDSFHKMPVELREPLKDWPTDFDDTNRNKLGQWLASNEEAFEYFKTASHKPYYWLERNVRDANGMMSILFPELAPLRYLVEAMFWNAKLNAANGQYQKGFEDISACYRAGRQKCRTPSFLIEQINGMSIKEKALTAAMNIIDKCEVTTEDLRNFQLAIQGEFEKDTCALDFETERLSLYDILQRIFVYNSRGTGRFSWSTAHYFETMCGNHENFILKCKLLWSCFVGPTHNEMIKNTEEIFFLFEPLRTETPWQLHARDPNYFRKLDVSRCQDCDSFNILGMFSPNPTRLFHKYYQVKAGQNALLTIVAILRFKGDKNRFPDSLDELIAAGFLKSMPLDPYSDGSLIYKETKDNFLLYSVGEDFRDDGGSAVISFTSTGLGRQGLPEDKRRDIVFWPVKKFERREKVIESPPDTNEIIEYWKSVTGQKDTNDINFMNEVNLIREISSKS
ncbi:MAG: hypothetical protein JW749_04720 [Sedimentisphaerales bacterium]|nr:hypothetical protein [Sedimentisphaerales bacterium]